MRKATLWCVVAYLAAAVIAYLPALRNPQFLCDDFILLGQIKHGYGIWDSPEAVFYRPAICTALSVLWRLFSNHPLPYYLFNLGLLVAAAMVLREVWEVATNTQGRGAFVVGMLFVLWITHSESISWISGMTDSLAVLFSALALLAYLRHLREPSVSRFLLSIVCLWLGFLCKEASLTWGLILVVFGLFTVSLRGQWLRRVSEAFVLLILTLAYVAWRAHVLGKWVGGYPHGAHIPTSVHGVVGKLEKHFANAFVPFDKLLALWVGDKWVTLLTTAVAAGSLALLLRKLPKRDENPVWVDATALVLSGCAVVRALIVTLPFYLFDMFRLQMVAAGAVLIGLLGFWVYRAKPKNILRSRWLFWVVSGLALVIHANTFDMGYGFLLFAAHLWFSYATRPVQETAEQDLVWCRVGLAALACTVLAIAPASTLRVNLSGEYNRFSYGPSFFSAIVLVCVGLLYIRAVRWRIGAAVVSLMASCAFLFENNIQWGLASNISGETTGLIRSMMPVRKVYILSVPGSMEGSILFRIGVQTVAQAALLNDDVQIRTATISIGTVDGDKIEVKKLSPSRFALSLYPSSRSKRFARCFLIRDEELLTNGWFNFVRGPNPADGAFGVQLVDFDPSRDKVMVVDGTSARLIE